MNLYETAIRHTNPNTTQDLVIPIDLIPSVDHQTMVNNVLANQDRDVPWLNECQAHNRVAIICGAGPSLADTVDELKAIEGDVFASNSAAKYLIDRGIDVDHQVTLDPNKIILTDFEPRAKSHLLASIVETDLFAMSQNATLWHPNIKWLEDLIKPDCKPFVYIGGGITVTNSAMCIAWTLGYRTFHVFGVDSSFRNGNTHATGAQIIEPYRITVSNNGKNYESSYDMKQQAVVFLEIHKQLSAAGGKIHVYGSGLLPDIFNAN
jgi:hypothetical protein